MATGTQPFAQPIAVPAESSTVPKRVRTIELLLVVLTGTYMPYLGTIYYLVTGASGTAHQRGPDWYRAAHMFGFEFTALAMTAYILYRRGGSPASLGFSLRWSDLWSGILVWIGAFGVNIVWNFFYFRAYYLWFGSYPFRRDLRGVLDMRLTLVWAVMVIVNGFYEEGIVRGFVTSDLTALTGNRWIAGAASVLLQLGYHGYQGITNMILILPMFVFFAVYYARTGKLTPLIVAHSIQDLLAFGLHSG